MNLGTPNLHSKSQLHTISLKFKLGLFMTTRGASIWDVYFRTYNCSVYKCHFFSFLLFSLLNLYSVRIWQIYYNFVQVCDLSAWQMCVLYQRLVCVNYFLHLALGILFWKHFISKQIWTETFYEHAEYTTWTNVWEIPVTNCSPDLCSRDTWASWSSRKAGWSEGYSGSSKPNRTCHRTASHSTNSTEGTN